MKKKKQLEIVKDNIEAIKTDLDANVPIVELCTRYGLVASVMYRHLQELGINYKKRYKPNNGCRRESTITRDFVEMHKNNLLTKKWGSSC